MCKNNKLLTAKAEVMTIISLWHHFCALLASFSVNLTWNYNIYPEIKFILNMHRAQCTEHRNCLSEQRARRSVLKEYILV